MLSILALTFVAVMAALIVGCSILRVTPGFFPAVAKLYAGKIYRRVRSGRWTCVMCRRPITWWIKGQVPLCDFHYEARRAYLVGESDVL
jgi:hypothetical protein